MEDELAWAAGFIDGEGCFSINRGSRSKIVRFSLSVAQSDPRPLQRLADIAGHGKVNGPYSFPSAKLSTKPTYRWALTGRRAEWFFGQIEPYMCEPKKVQGNAILRQIKVDNESRVDI